MKNFSTQCVSKIMGKTTRKNSMEEKPCKQTLNFLSQFARVYHAEPDIRKDLCGFVLN
jgi:phosphoribosylformimino-5-aminoimidazole carboxamide ribonucleotide (ProFAR) isomerase